MDTNGNKAGKQFGLFAVLLVMVVFALQQASQLSVTPVGEGLDFYGHWSYLHFYAEENRWPTPEEKSVPDYLRILSWTLPAPDHSAGDKYKEWAGLDPDERSERIAAFAEPDEKNHYTEPNYQAQHPPLYYWLASKVYKRMGSLSLEMKNYILSCMSILLATAAFPGFYLIFRTILTRNQSLLLLLCIAWYPNLMPFIARVTNDSLAFLLITYAVWACTARPLRLTHALLCGCLVVAGCFTKTYALAIAPACFLCCALDFSKGYRFGIRIRWGSAVAMGVVLCAGLLLLFYMNYEQTGHMLVLRDIRETASFTMGEKLSAFLTVPLVWFWGGMLKGFFWCGYWSFVSPGEYFYVPLLVALFFFVFRASAMRRKNSLLGLNKLWPHYLLITFFLLGMLWHAAMFDLRAQVSGDTVHSGNEGWYMNVLLASVVLIVFALIKMRISEKSFARVLVISTVCFVVWNVIARLAMYGFWGGATGVSGRIRYVNWSDVVAGLTSSECYQAWFSLPGIIEPVALSMVLPLVLAIGGSIGLIVLSGRSETPTRRV